MLLISNGNAVASKVEVASSFLAKSRGLMFRRSIPEDYAMLFTFKKPEKVSLHMVFVPFPIDVLLLDTGMRILETRYLKAWIGLLNSKTKVSYVVEMPAGSIARHKLKIGQQLSLVD
ncbi:uncharacterized membrane protein (UPF0127 family) [Methanohalophilus levihalophilus]|uniref:DUF192 domain-containing protein n=1 Tax=Methanohalophilus levihalophilus TaxID=1431282 RepID=UPI001AE6D924|nr:DUF192 domain-containing protein [Methanohalophilus levihalophilus]MBP2030136.1 uncharacterized membrane protein (UPF0127 family) [Methanohalophilus levihalophilus]